MSPQLDMGLVLDIVVLAAIYLAVSAVYVWLALDHRAGDDGP